MKTSVVSSLIKELDEVSTHSLGNYIESIHLHSGRHHIMGGIHPYSCRLLLNYLEQGSTKIQKMPGIFCILRTALHLAPYLCHFFI